MNLGRAVLTIGGWTSLSRITGLAREMLVARYLGAGPVADAFFVAFRFPNLFRSLFAEGAFNPAFVPLFAGRLEAGGHRAAHEFAEQCYSVLAVILLGFVALMEIAMPWAIRGLAPGFGDTPGKVALAVTLSRITFPYLLFIALVSLQSGVLNALGRFAAAAGTPVLLNVVSIAVLVLLAPYTPNPGYAMAWGVFASGIAQFAWLVISVRRADMPLHFVWPRLNPPVKLMLRRVVPGAIGAGVYQVNLVVNTMIASTIANGAVSYINYAERVNQLPLGIVGVAIGTALLPLLSVQIKTGKLLEAIESQNRAMELGLLLTLPASAALLVIAHPIVAVLFERGHFGAFDTDAVAGTLTLLCSGLPAYVLVKVLTPGFFAREDTTTPVRIAMSTMVLNIVLNLSLVHSMRWLGMALSTALSAWMNVILLAVFLHRRGLFRMDKRLLSRLPRILLACAGMCGALALARNELTHALELPGWRYGAVALLVALGMIVYGALVLVLRAARPSEFKALMRRERNISAAVLTGEGQ